MIRTIIERPVRSGEVPLAVHPEWTERFPWLRFAVTRRGEAEPFDLGLSGDQPVGGAMGRWRTLRRALEARTLVHAHQVHASDIAVHDECADGLLFLEGVDGHASDRPGVFLTVSVADCVPVVIADPRYRAVAAVHAGWRGTAAGVLERALAVMGERWESDPADLHIHLGPAICGRCYEVGPDVHAAVRPQLAPPPGPCPIDLRACLAERALARGADAEHLTASEHCTLCGPGDFFSHRGGHAERQVAVIGLR